MDSLAGLQRQEVLEISMKPGYLLEERADRFGGHAVAHGQDQAYLGASPPCVWEIPVNRGQVWTVKLISISKNKLLIDCQCVQDQASCTSGRSANNRRYAIALLAHGRSGLHRAHATMPQRLVCPAAAFHQ